MPWILLEDQLMIERLSEVRSLVGLLWSVTSSPKIHQNLFDMEQDFVVSNSSLPKIYKSLKPFLILN